MTLNEQADLILGPAAALIGLCWLLDAPAAGWSVCGALLVLGLVFSVGKGPLGTFDEGHSASALATSVPLVLARKSQTDLIRRKSGSFWILICFEVIEI